MARAFGIEPTSLNARVNNGMSVEEALKKPFPKKNKYLCDGRDIVKKLWEKKKNRSVTYRGKKYPNLSKAISDLEIKEAPSTIKNRMEKHGMSFEEVIDADPRMFKCGRWTLTQDEYNHLLALKHYLGLKSLVETVSFAVEKEINRHQGNATYQYYLEETRKGALDEGK